MKVSSAADLNPRQKAAIVVLALGPGARVLLQQLDGQEVEQLAEEIVQLGEIPDAVRDEVLVEFQNRISALQATAGGGGLERAAEVLEARMGKADAERAVRSMEWRANDALYAWVRKDPKRFVALLEPEHPQTCAFLLTQLPVDVAGAALAAFPEEQRCDVAWRVATMDSISPRVAEVVHRVLSGRLVAQTTGRRAEAMGGAQKAAGLLNMVQAEAQKSVFEAFTARDADLAKRIRKLMFVFKDVLLLDDRGIQRVLKEVDTKTLVLALKTADEPIRKKVFRNVSERAAQLIQEEMEFLKNFKPNEVEEARDTIIEHIRLLEEQGEIVVNRGGPV